MNFNMKNQSLPPASTRKRNAARVGGIPFFQHSFCAIFFYRWYFCWYSS